MRVDAGGVQLEVLGFFEGALDGDSEAPPQLLLHGFTGSGAGWWDVLHDLGSGRAVFAPDLVGHAESDAPGDPSRYAMRAQVQQLVALLDHLQVEQCDVLGYSMGGRLALGLALQAPRRVRRLALESCSAGIEDAKEREARRAEDFALAERIEREGVEAFVERWLQQPLFATQRRLGQEWLARARAERLRHTAQGLANSLRGFGQGSMPPLWSRLGELCAPTLLVGGSLDATYADLMARAAAAMREPRTVAVPEAGHAVHVERPAEFARTVAEFLG